MTEKILSTKKKGMLVMILTIFLYALAIGGCIGCGIALAKGAVPVFPVVGLVICCAWMALGWILFLGLRILKPQEALVLTLFGKYIGTLKEPGFYFVNPFCVSVNPASKTKLSQSGDVDTSAQKNLSLSTLLLSGSSSSDASLSNKKISLKVMTLNNSRQKINDCLGNPVEIGIAVTWRVVDTAKAVFHVDNYKEYLSLQCDSALRNIVRLYPAKNVTIPLEKYLFALSLENSLVKDPHSNGVSTCVIIPTERTISDT